MMCRVVQEGVSRVDVRREKYEVSERMMMADEVVCPVL